MHFFELVEYLNSCKVSVLRPCESFSVMSLLSVDAELGHAMRYRSEPSHGGRVARLLPMPLHGWYPTIPVPKLLEVAGDGPSRPLDITTRSTDSANHQWQNPPRVFAALELSSLSSWSPPSVRHPLPQAPQLHCHAALPAVVHFPASLAKVPVVCSRRARSTPQQTKSPYPTGQSSPC